jgi:hypothetical protein
MGQFVFRSWLGVVLIASIWAALSPLSGGDLLLYIVRVAVFCGIAAIAYYVGWRIIHREAPRGD